MIQTSNFFSENKEDYYIDRCDIRICLLLFTPIRGRFLTQKIRDLSKNWVNFG